MNRPFRILMPLLAFVVAPYVPCAAAPTSRPAEEMSLARAANEFAIDLYKSLDQTDRNLVVSPYSIYTLLCILREGAAGDAAKSLDKVLGSAVDAKARGARLRGFNDFLSGKDAKPKNKQKELVCTVSNSVWLDLAIRPADAFLATVGRDYAAHVSRLDFGDTNTASHRINDWIGAQTHDRIRDLAQPTDLVGVRAAVANAVYFRGSWSHGFERDGTHDADFHPARGKSMRVPTMHLKEHQPYFRGDGIQLVRLSYTINEPYEGMASCEFVLIVPDQPDGLPKLEARLDVPKLERWIKGSEPTETEWKQWSDQRPANAGDEQAMNKWFDRSPAKEVNLAMPKFTTAARPPVRRALDRLAGGSLFGPMPADFSAAGLGDIVDWRILHGARIDVDERGTEAAAATFGGGLFGGVPTGPVDLNVDRPFLYLIREETSGAIIFIGRVTDPSKP